MTFCLEIILPFDPSLLEMKSTLMLMPTSIQKSRLLDDVNVWRSTCYLTKKGEILEYIIFYLYSLITHF